MGQSRHDGDLHVNGALTAKTMTPPDGTITNAMVNASAGIVYTKLEHLMAFVHSQSGTVASATLPIGFVRGATGTMLTISAGSIVAAIGAATVTIDLKKNGTTMLSGVITLDNANTARVIEDGTLSVTSLAADDFLELVITATAGGGTLPTGFGVQVWWKELAS